MTTPPPVGSVAAAIIAGSVAATIHLVFVLVLGYLILVRPGGEGEGWLYVAVPDLPVYFLSFIVPSALSSGPIFPLIWFGLVGTAQWFVIMWAIARWLSK